MTPHDTSDAIAQWQRTMVWRIETSADPRALALHLVRACAQTRQNARDLGQEVRAAQKKLRILQGAYVVLLVCFLAHTWGYVVP